MRLSAGFKNAFKVLVLIVALMIVCAIWPATSGVDRSKKARAKSDVTQVTTALAAYQVEYGQSLEGELPQIFAALRGDNPRKVVFIEVDPKSMNERGEFVDPWGTPYKLAPTPNRRLHTLVGIYSFGKGKKDDQGAEGSDDIVSWR